MIHIAAPHGVLNTYGELPELKSRLGIAGNSYDSALWMAIHAASRDVDAFCNRRFYVEHAVRYFDVADAEGFVLPDLVSISSMMEDADRDRVYEVERRPADYLLYPLNAEPASPSGRPFNLVRADPQGPPPGVYHRGGSRCRSRACGATGRTRWTCIPRLISMGRLPHHQTSSR